MAKSRVGKFFGILAPWLMWAVLGYLCWGAIFRSGSKPEPGPHPTHNDPRF